MTFLELENPIEVTTSDGHDGLAIICMDYGVHLNTAWIVILTDGRIKHYTSEQIKVARNYTFNLGMNIGQA